MFKLEKCAFADVWKVAITEMLGFTPKLSYSKRGRLQPNVCISWPPAWIPLFCFKVGIFKHDLMQRVQETCCFLFFFSSRSLMTKKGYWTNGARASLQFASICNMENVVEYRGCSWFTFRAFNCLLLRHITGVLYLLMLPALYVPLGFIIHVPSESSIILTAQERAPAAMDAKCFVVISQNIA